MDIVLPYTYGLFGHVAEGSEEEMGEMRHKLGKNVWPKIEQENRWLTKMYNFMCVFLCLYVVSSNILG